MRSDRVVFLAETVKAPLLGTDMAGGRNNGFLFEGAVHAFVAPVLLWTPGFDQLGNDPKFDPPDGQL